jgi:hypothetical protein
MRAGLQRQRIARCAGHPERDIDRLRIQRHPG